MNVLNFQRLRPPTELILIALPSDADTGVYGLTGIAVAALVSGGAPDDLEGAKLTPSVDVSGSDPVSGTVEVFFASFVSPFGTVDAIASYLNGLLSVLSTPTQNS